MGSLGSLLWQQFCLQQSLVVIKLLSLFFTSEPCRNQPGNFWYCWGIPRGGQHWPEVCKRHCPPFSSSWQWQEGQCQLSPASSAISAPRQAGHNFPPLASSAFANASVNLQSSLGFDSISDGHVYAGSNGFSVHRQLWHGWDIPLQLSSIYFRRFLLHRGTGLLLSCWLLWKAMCCKYSILLSLDETVSQFKIWLWERDSKGEFPFHYACSGLGLCCTDQLPNIRVF